MSIHAKLATTWYTNTYSDQPKEFVLTKRQMSDLIQEWEALEQFKNKIKETFKEIVNG